MTFKIKNKIRRLKRSFLKDYGEFWVKTDLEKVYSFFCKTTLFSTPLQPPVPLPAAWGAESANYELERIFEFALFSTFLLKMRWNFQSNAIFHLWEKLVSLLNPLKNWYYKKKENREKNTTLKGHISKTRTLPNLPA